MTTTAQIAGIVRRLELLECRSAWREGLVNASPGRMLLVRTRKWPCPRLVQYKPAMDRYIYVDPLLHIAYGPLPDNEATDDYDFIEVAE